MLNFNNIRSNNRRRSYAVWPRAELYEELGDELNIQIHSQNKRFIKRIKEAYERLKENPIGIRLVEDIRRLRIDKKDPCWIVDCNTTYTKEEKIHPLENSSFLFKTEDQIADLIYINIDQNFHYYGFYKEDLQDKPPSEVIPLRKFISDPSELDITLFHEMNHFRHYLQVGAKAYDDRHEPYNKYYFKEELKTLMYSQEEAIQLTGRYYDSVHDVVNEMSYRFYRQCTAIRYPYKNDTPNEYVRAISTAGYFSDLLTQN